MQRRKRRGLHALLFSLVAGIVAAARAQEDGREQQWAAGFTSVEQRGAGLEWQEQLERGAPPEAHTLQQLTSLLAWQAAPTGHLGPRGCWL